MGNTVGSLSEVQRAIVLGSLLGDGSMRCKTNALLEINHAASQRAYVDWKYDHLIDLVRTPPRPRRGNGSRVAYRFVTRSLPALTPYFHLFYKAGRKKVPEIELSALTLAVWFMDDGCKSRNAVYLNTQQFDMVGQELLVRLLKEQWDIGATLNRDKCYRRIRVSVDGTTRFGRLVEPYLLPELRYKLPQVTP
jgi:LAGLIDADG DNA endonuclease family protein